MSARRGSGEGSVYREGAGWRATVEAGRDPVTGKRRRKVLRGKSKADVLRQLAEVRRQADRGIGFGPSIKLNLWLDQWFADVVEPRVGSPNTAAAYRRHIEKHLKPGLGHLSLRKLTPEDVDRFFQSRRDLGLSRSHVGRMRMLLADSLRHAERRGLVDRNVAQLAVVPRCKPADERTSLTVDEVRSMIKAAEGARLEALVLCGLVLGLRPGELAGLLWTDLDLEGPLPKVSITGSMKHEPGGVLRRGAVKRSTAGQRTLALPPVLVGALREHRVRQSDERDAAGDLWREQGLVFCSQVGTPLDPANLRRSFRRVAERAGIKGAFPYLMRHTVVSQLLDQGATIDEIADLTGDDPTTLYKHYRHRVQPVATVAAERWASIHGVGPSADLDGAAK
ncbi:MAG: tyrosine-type recombinase/integrase [Acidimicrobiales bacterium]